MHRAISRLEAAGLVRDIEERLAKEDDYRKAYQDAHHTTAILIRKELHRIGADRWFFSAIRDRGIGGVSELSHVKCLHMHVANLLCGVDNPVGKTVLEMLRHRECHEEILCKGAVEFERATPG